MVFSFDQCTSREEEEEEEVEEEEEEEEGELQKLLSLG